MSLPYLTVGISGAEPDADVGVRAVKAAVGVEDAGLGAVVPMRPRKESAFDLFLMYATDY